MWSLILESPDKAAQVVTALVAIIALPVAYFQVTSARNAQQQAVANAYYRDYLKLAFENPKLANPHHAKVDPIAKTACADDESLDKYVAFEKYQWFVSVMLRACEEISLSPRASSWKPTVLDQLGTHYAYLDSQHFRDSKHLEQFSEDLQDLVEEAIAREKRTENVGGEA